MTQDDIAIVERYRGVGIHDFQTRERIDTVVRPAIAAVFGLAAPDLLFSYLQAAENPPEARLFALAKLTALGEAQRSGHHRATFDLAEAAAWCAGLRRPAGRAPIFTAGCWTRRAAPLLRARRSIGCGSWPPKGRADGRRRALALPPPCCLARARRPGAAAARPRAVPRAASIAGQRRRKCRFLAR